MRVCCTHIMAHPKVQKRFLRARLDIVGALQRAFKPEVACVDL